MMFTPKFSITTVIIGLLLIFVGVWQLATDLKFRASATYTKMEVVGQREAMCRGGRGARDYPCIYPTVAHKDAEGRRQLFVLKESQRTESFRSELKKNNNQMEVLYIPNGPSPEDDQIFEDNGDLILLGLLALLSGIGILEKERRDLIRIRKVAALPTGPPDSFLHIGKRRH